MNLNEYQKKARNTAIYSDKFRMLYPALGITGECGEVAEKVKKLIRDDNCQTTPERTSAIAKELGDCCWYLANICCDTCIDLNVMYEMKGYCLVQTVHKLTLPQLVLSLNRQAAAIAEALEHWFYEYECLMTQKWRFDQIPQHLSTIMVCIEEIAHRCGFTLEEIYVANIEKLLSRQERGTLKGDGDSR